MATLDWDLTLRLWNLSTGKEIHRLGKSHRGKVALSDDGKLLALAYADAEFGGGAINVWDAIGGKKLREFPIPPGSGRRRQNDISSLAFSPDAKVLAMTGGYLPGITLLDAVTGKELRRFPKEIHSTDRFAFTPGGKRIVTGLQDGFFRAYSLETGKEMARLKGSEDRITRLAISPDGRLLASGNVDGTTLIWDAKALVGKKE